jgi:hypothetical protein
MIELLLTGLSYIVVFWVGFFVAGALAVAKRSDEDEVEANVRETLRTGAVVPAIRAMRTR